jgi:hypothetical protein
MVKRFAHCEATKTEVADIFKIVVIFYQIARVISQKSKIKISFPQENLQSQIKVMRSHSVRILNHTTQDTYYDVLQVMNNSVYKNALLSNTVFAKLTSIRTPFSFDKT